jgi:GTP-binding protein YchF
MGLSVGIVGLPNVGKSTLFNALSSQQVEATNYAFCTIDPNVGVVPVPDERFDAIVDLLEPKTRVPATVDFVDIAGLVRGASKGEGKGNAFLAHIRQCDAVAHVVRCFEDESVAHVEGRIDPVSDIETIQTELCLRDLETVQKRLEKAQKAAKGNDPVEKATVAVCQRLVESLDAGRNASCVEPEDETERVIIRDLFLLTNKPVFYVANVNEEQLAGIDSDTLIQQVRQIAGKAGAPVEVICSAMEAEIMQLPPEERPEFLESMGLSRPSLNNVIRTGYQMLDLITFFSTLSDEVRAWTVKRGTRAPGAAGKIHSDFERGFIRAEVVQWSDLVELGSEAACRSAARMSVQGKDYVVQDGDVIQFKFNV